MARRIIECVANFSEGRDSSVVDALAEAVRRGHGVALLHRTSDPDHNRSVLTFAGDPESVMAAAVRAVRVAAERIDLTRHQGVHPRVGAADVVPFVPVEAVSLEECVALAHQAGREIWSTCGVPVYYYEAAALRPDRSKLEVVRRGGFEALRDDATEVPDRAPDVGGPALHPTAGACIVGARKFLVAWNVNLSGGTLDDAIAIAKRIRASSGGFPAVKALGLPLASRGQVQVSVNLTDLDQTPLHLVFEAIEVEAVRRGMTVVGSEIIGLVPRGALERAAERFLRFENFDPANVLETRITDALPLTVDDLFAALESPSRATGGGSAAAAAAAMGASLAILVCRIARIDPADLVRSRQFFTRAITGDAEAFAELMRRSNPDPEDVVTAAETPLAIAAQARLLSERLAELKGRTPEKLMSDIDTAVALCEAARVGALSTARANMLRITDAGVRAQLESEAEKLQ